MLRVLNKSFNGHHDLLYWILHLPGRSGMKDMNFLMQTIQ